MVNATGINIINLPNDVNDALFGGDAGYLEASRILLCLVCMMIVMMPMIMAKQKMQSTAVVAVLAVSALTIIGWMPAYVFMILILVMAALLATKVADWFGS
jgi:hypothetical protein